MKYFFTIIFAFSICYSNSLGDPGSILLKNKLDKYYFKGVIFEDKLQDIEIPFSLPILYTPDTNQIVTVYDIVEKFGEPTNEIVATLEYHFNKDGDISTFKYGNNDSCEYLYQNRMLSEIRYSSGEITKIKYDSASNRIGDFVYNNSGDLKTKFDYLYNFTISGHPNKPGSFLGSETDVRFGENRVLNIFSVLLTNNGDIDSLIITKENRIHFTSSVIRKLVFKNEQLQSAFLKLNSPVMINGYAQGNDSANINDIYHFDSVGKITERIISANRGNSVLKESVGSVVKHVYIYSKEGLPIKINQFEEKEIGIKTQSVLTKIAEIQYISTKTNSKISTKKQLLKK